MKTTKLCDLCHCDLYFGDKDETYVKVEAILPGRRMNITLCEACLPRTIATITQMHTTGPTIVIDDGIVRPNSDDVN
jgi:hypothetical protein